MKRGVLYACVLAGLALGAAAAEPATVAPVTSDLLALLVPDACTADAAGRQDWKPADDAGVERLCAPTCFSDRQCDRFCGPGLGRCVPDPHCGKVCSCGGGGETGRH